MLLRNVTLKGIQNGSITQAFRRWKRPTVKAGGTLNTRIGQLAILAVDAIGPEEITENDAAAAGYPTVGMLMEELAKRDGEALYRIRFELAGPDPLIALREEIPTKEELQKIILKLNRMDSRSSTGPWIRAVLKMVRARPAERAGNLADDFGLEKLEFKARVRRLKTIGLTESLPVGYRLSPRGRSVLDALQNSE